MAEQLLVMSCYTGLTLRVNKQGDRALMAFDELRAAGVRPSTHTFNIAIAACGTEPGTRLQVCARAIPACILYAGHESQLVRFHVFFLVMILPRASVVHGGATLCLQLAVNCLTLTG